MQILDLRLDKSFRFGSFGRLTGLVDVFNLTNSGVVTSSRTTSAANGPFGEVLGILNPRVVRFGVRYDF